MSPSRNAEHMGYDTRKEWDMDFPREPELPPPPKVNMILLTDDEQATALRALRYSHKALEARAKSEHSDNNEAARNLLAVELLIQTMEHPKRVVANGVWCCACPQWRQPTEAKCEKCGTVKP